MDKGYLTSLFTGLTWSPLAPAPWLWRQQVLDWGWGSQRLGIHGTSVTWACLGQFFRSESKATGVAAAGPSRSGWTASFPCNCQVVSHGTCLHHSNSLGRSPGYGPGRFMVACGGGDCICWEEVESSLFHSLLRAGTVSSGEDPVQVFITCCQIPNVSLERTGFHPWQPEHFWGCHQLCDILLAGSFPLCKASWLFTVITTVVLQDNTQPGSPGDPKESLPCLKHLDSTAEPPPPAAPTHHPFALGLAGEVCFEVNRPFLAPEGTMVLCQPASCGAQLSVQSPGECSVSQENKCLASRMDHGSLLELAEGRQPGSTKQCCHFAAGCSQREWY